MMLNKEKFAIYSAGLLQGIVLVAFPAVSTILTSPHDYAFSSTIYGSLFIPQSLLSIGASACNPWFLRAIGSKMVFLLGLIANLIAMVLLGLSTLVMKDQDIAYPLLLLATGCLGLGFGMVVPTINGIAALLNPTKVDSMLLALNALLGMGTALSPVFVSIFVSFGFWWGLPCLLSILLVLLLLFSLNLYLPGGKLAITPGDAKAMVIPARFWIFAAFALLYGIMETLNGNWISIYMGKHLHASITVQSLALTAFWGMVTFGRVFFAIMGKYFKEQLAFQISPFISAVAFLIIASLPSGKDYWGIFAFGLTGFGCSTLLPLIISFGNQQLKTITSSVPGMIISFYLLGYGIAAFGVGPLEDIAHISLRGVYAMGAVLSAVLGVISLVIVQTKNEKHL